MNTNLGDTIIPACLDCPPSSDLCIHDQELLPLAEAIARHFDAENPDTGKFLVDADQLVDTIGPGPYTTRRLDVDYVVFTEAGSQKTRESYDPFKKAVFLEIPIADATDIFRFLGD